MKKFLKTQGISIRLTNAAHIVRENPFLVSTRNCLPKKRECFLETRVESSKVTFKKIEDQIHRRILLLAVDPLDKAGLLCNANSTGVAD